MEIGGRLRDRLVQMAANAGHAAQGLAKLLVKHGGSTGDLADSTVAYSGPAAVSR
jgi:hypothetical protein